MTPAAIFEPSGLTRAEALACIPHLRAFAAMLTGSPRRGDDLVRDTIEQTLAAVNRPRAGNDLNLQMFSVMHRLHYGARRPSAEGPAQQRESPSSDEDGIEPDYLLRIGRLCDEQREALILTVASGLSYQHAADVCECRTADIENRVSEAWCEIIAETKEKGRRPAVGNLVRAGTGLTAQHHC